MCLLRFPGKCSVAIHRTVVWFYCIRYHSLHFWLRRSLVFFFFSDRLRWDNLEELPRERGMWWNFFISFINGLRGCLTGKPYQKFNLFLNSTARLRTSIYSASLSSHRESLIFLPFLLPYTVFSLITFHLVLSLLTIISQVYFPATSF